MRVVVVVVVAVAYFSVLSQHFLGEETTKNLRIISFWAEKLT
jgi:hypothetical protein